MQMTEKLLEELRARVLRELSPKRAAHTLGVEAMAARLAALYCPEKEGMLRAAALLHDITKELPQERQQAILDGHGVVLRPDEAVAPRTWHAITAALCVPAEYPALSDGELLSAIRWHTTGHADMTVPEIILYLADYIEETREHACCIALRRTFFEAEPERMPKDARLLHLYRVMLDSLETTLSDLKARGKTICLDTLGAMEYFKNKTK